MQVIGWHVTVTSLHNRALGPLKLMHLLAPQTRAASQKKRE
jgi:hypothetical protein